MPLEHITNIIFFSDDTTAVKTEFLHLVENFQQKQVYCSVSIFPLLLTHKLFTLQLKKLRIVSSAGWNQSGAGLLYLITFMSQV